MDEICVVEAQREREIKPITRTVSDPTLRIVSLSLLLLLDRDPIASCSYYDAYGPIQPL